jgi:hypothetical protein
LEYTQICRLFLASHSTAHSRGRAANFIETTTAAKRELTVNTLHKLKFVKILCRTHVLFRSLNQIKTWCKGYRDLPVNNHSFHSGHSISRTQCHCLFSHPVLWLVQPVSSSRTV